MPNLLEIFNLQMQRIAILNDNTVYSANNITLEQRLNQIDTLSFQLPLSSTKWQYCLNEQIVRWQNEYYIIKNVDYTHSIETKKATVQCKHLSSTLADQINQMINSVGKSARDIMNDILTDSGTSTSGWIVGTIQVENKNKSLQSQNQSMFSNLVKLADLYNAMLFFDSINRTVSLIDALPDRQVFLMKGKNIKQIDFHMNSDELITRLYVFGGDSDVSGLPISINSVNQINLNQSYIENYSFYTNQGITQSYINSNPHLFKKHLIWTANEYKDSQILYENAIRKLNILSQPKININVQGLDLSLLPQYFMQSIKLGEAVYLVDPDLNLKVQAKVVYYKKNFDNPIDMAIEITNIITYESVLKQLMDSSKATQKTVNALGLQRGSYIGGQIDLLKAQLLSTMSGVSTDKNGNLMIENTDKTQAFKLAGGIFGLGTRTTTERDNSIDYKYRTFGTPLGFTADLITLGMLRGGMVLWNLDNTDRDILDNNGNKLFTLPSGSLLIGNSPTDYMLYFNGSTQKLSLKNVEIDSYIKTTDMASQIQQNASSVKVAVGQYGTYNLLKHTDFSDVIGAVTPNNWWYWGGVTTYVNQGSSPYNTKGTIYIANPSTTTAGGLWQSSIPLTPNTKYTLSLAVTKESNVKSGSFVFEYMDGTGTTISSNSITLTFDGARHSYTFTTPSNFVYVKGGLYHTGSNSSGGGYLITMTYPKLEEGENATSWSPNSDDAVSQSSSYTNAQVNILNNAINARVQTANLSTEIQARAGDVQVAFNNITSNIQNSGGTFKIVNGKLVVVNGNSEVVIDGQYNMHKIIISGYMDCYLGAGYGDRQFDINHNMGYKPCFAIYMDADGGGYANQFPIIRMRDLNNMLIGGVFRAGSNNSVIHVTFSRDNTTATVAENVRIRYYIYKEVAL